MATIIGTRSPLFYRKVAGGLPAILDTSKFSGNVFYVDSNAAGAGDTEGHGSEPDSPFATIDYAIGRCTANQGDVILVLPGHAETINTAGGITCDKAGVSIIGLGNGEDRPTVTIGSSLDTATVLISAADVLLKNLILVPGNDGVDVLVDINADGAIIEDCELRSDETNAYQADTFVDINGGGANAADRCIIRRCVFRSITAGCNQAIEIGAVQADLRIEDNWIVGDYAVAGIHSGSILTNALIARNYIHNVNAGDWCVEFTDAATGLLVDNRFYANAAATTLDPGSMMCVNNHMVNAIDNSSIPVPTTAGGIMPVGAIGAASFVAGAIDAAAIAAAAIDAATFAADALQAMQDEAEDALEGENLDHLAATTTAAADMTTEVVDGSIISRILSKTSDTSSYSPTTDSLEMVSDKLGGFSGDGGAAQDDSVKASLDLAHTDIDAILADTGTDGVVVNSLTAAGQTAVEAEVEDALQAVALDHLMALDGATQVYPEQAAVDSTIAKMLAKGDPATPSTYSCVTDSQEALSDKMGGFSGDGGAAQDDSAKASLDLAHTDLDAIIADTQYLRTLDGATQVYPENAAVDSIIAKMIAKGDPATPSTYSCVTDSQEALSDKLGGFSGDGGAAQDDSVKASLDLAHTDLDSIISEIGGDDAATTDSLNGKLGTDTELADRSLYDLINGGGPAAAAAAAVPGNDVSLMGALRAVYNLAVPAVATGETDLDEGDYDWATAYPALLTITPAAGAPLADVVVYLDMAKAVEGFAAHYIAQTIQFYVERKVDGTNWRRDAAVLAAALAGNVAAARLVKIDIGDVGVSQAVRVTAVLSAEVDGTENTEIPYAVYYKALAAPTITPLVETV